ncbi:YtrH family sporulation protein [Alicyclobacillus sp. ALC3]|uniref:YtrH family sporulation protein n=1 Tax=Alicyclobacillus sp. ALC3 TaxID=2796143 RepID=UPI002379CA96|nr:YtrH family sporulation protein [Alicyclobacillus sp. ALC3]WDL98035.1 YtrH family sporulation protein [Alicyclobacillus sp. ALC3]
MSTNSLFFHNIVVDFCVALGMVVGGAVLGGIAAVFTHAAPMTTMVRLAGQLKIWALVSTLGGTMDTLRAIESGVLERQLVPMGKQFAYLVAAFLGCQLGYIVIRWMAGNDLP